MLNLNALSIGKQGYGRQTGSPVLYCLRLSAFLIVSFIIGAYLCFSPRINQDYYNDKVLFRPTKCQQLNVHWFGRTALEVSFPSATGERLSGLFFGAQNATRTVLIHHGMAHNLNQHTIGIQPFLQPNTAVFIYDYQGFGKSDGKPTIAGLAADARGAYDYLVQTQHVNPATIVHYGASIGTGPAVAIAAEKPCAGLILFAPYTSIKSVAYQTFPFLKIYPDFLLAEKDLDSLTAIKRVHAPVLILHGALDPCIPVGEGDKLFAAANNPKHFIRIEDSGHTQFTKRSQIDAVIRFVNSPA